ncbi:MAG: glycerophosphodiester phosphodiesterase family protein [Xenococcaceae cyanobacterium MO_188.B19]|nr:glycerophosphodiester phosphodiesterase family protein [Xenococcaceae cyanobacterium MO_188.B19]
MSWLNSRKLLCIGHRGAMGHEPENTILSINKAISLGVDAVEIDVHRVGNKLIVIHDLNLSRTTNGEGYITDKSFSYLSSLDAGKGEQIPTLEAVFNAVNRQVGINIELKSKYIATLIVDLIHFYLNQGWSYDDFIISSFNHYELQQVRHLDSKINLGLLLYGVPLDYLKIAAKLKVTTIINNYNFIDLDFINDVHQKDFKCWAYTVNSLEDVEMMTKLKIDGIITNYPENIPQKFPMF